MQPRRFKIAPAPDNSGYQIYGKRDGLLQRFKPMRVCYQGFDANLVFVPKHIAPDIFAEPDTAFKMIVKSFNAENETYIVDFTFISERHQRWRYSRIPNAINSTRDKLLEQLQIDLHKMKW